MIADERRLTADMLEGLTAEQWDAPSLCDGWRIREVVAHLLMPFSVSLPKMALMLTRSGFDLNRVSDRFAKRDKRSNPELAAALRRDAGHRFTPPGLGPEAPLTDIVVHTQDIARPLGISRSIPTERAHVVLDFLMSPKATRGFVRAGVTEGLTFTSVDTGWLHGSGSGVTGSAPDLILAIAGRQSAIDALSGNGVEILRSRLDD